MTLHKVTISQLPITPYYHLTLLLVLLSNYHLRVLFIYLLIYLHLAIHFLKYFYPLEYNP